MSKPLGVEHAIRMGTRVVYPHLQRGWCISAALVHFGVCRFVGVIPSGIVVPVIGGMYFRGFLLPRLAHPGPTAVVWNAALMTFYRLWTPPLAMTRFVMLLPTA